VLGKPHSPEEYGRVLELPARCIHDTHAPTTWTSQDTLGPTASPPTLCAFTSVDKQRSPAANTRQGIQGLGPAWRRTTAYSYAARRKRATHLPLYARPAGRTSIPERPARPFHLAGSSRQEWNDVNGEPFQKPHGHYADGGSTAA
jgi:hypothetical protein